MNGLNVTVPTATTPPVSDIEMIDRRELNYLEHEFVSLTLSTFRTPNAVFEDRIDEIRDLVGSEIVSSWFNEAVKLCAKK
jgi:hypothetical protein